MPTVDTTRYFTESLSREERIRLRAEAIYRQRGNRPGSAKRTGSWPKKKFARLKIAQSTRPRKSLFRPAIRRRIEAIKSR
jgi:hypothetical protein